MKKNKLLINNKNKKINNYTKNKNNIKKKKFLKLFPIFKWK